MLQIQGKITHVLPVESGTSKAGKEWSKQDFVIETEDQFPKSVCFTLFGDKVSILDNFNEGDFVDVFFNLESREFNGRWYSNVNAWKVELVQQDTQANEPTSEFPTSSTPDFGNENNNPEDQTDDLPF